MEAVASALIDDSGMGHALNLVDAQLYDHVLGWAAVNDAIENEAQLQDWLPIISSYLVGATAYRHLTVLRDTFSRLAFREALAAGTSGEPFPLERIVAASRRQWPELRVGQQSVQVGPVEVNSNARLFLSILQRLPFWLPPGREIEWDHIYAQALSTRMRWRGSDGQQRLQNHSKRGLVWHGANLWALDGPLNLAASDLRPSAKFEFLAGLPSSDGRHPGLWPDEGFLSDEERALLLEAERLIWEDQIDLGMNPFEAYVEGRAERIRAAISALFPTIRLFAADADIDPYSFDDRLIPPQLTRVPLVLAPATVDRAEADDADGGVLSSDEIRAIAYEFLREKDSSRTIGQHYYDILHAVEAVGRVGGGDPAPRVYGVLNNAPGLFVALGSGRFTWVARSASGRRYWVMRTDRGNRSALWAELAQGRLRQGWGWAEDQDLRKLQAVARGDGVWTESQRAAARNRRMLSSEPNSIQIGDLIVVPHMPAGGRWSLARVIGAYVYGSADGWADYRHVLPVELLSGPAGIDPNRPVISKQLRSSLRNQSRMWNIDPVGPDVETLVASIAPNVT